MARDERRGAACRTACAARSVRAHAAPPSKARVEDLAHTLAVFGASKGLTKERIDAILLQMEPDAKGLVDTGLYMALMLGDA